jgi:hypothetical protein
MNKPIKHESEPYWDYFEVRDYLLEKKHEFNERKFWHEVCELHNISNGSYFWLDAKAENWDSQVTSEFKAALRSEFPEEKTFKFWVEW